MFRPNGGYKPTSPSFPTTITKAFFMRFLLLKDLIHPLKSLPSRFRGPHPTFEPFLFTFKSSCIGKSDPRVCFPNRQSQIYNRHQKIYHAAVNYLKSQIRCKFSLGEPS